MAGLQPTKVTSFDMDVGAFSVSPDGRKFAFYASTSKPVQSYTEPDLWVLDIAANAQPRNLTSAFNYDVGSGVGGDNAAPRGGGGRSQGRSGPRRRDRGLRPARRRVAERGVGPPARALRRAARSAVSYVLRARGVDHARAFARRRRWRWRAPGAGLRWRSPPRP